MIFLGTAGTPPSNIEMIGVVIVMLAFIGFMAYTVRHQQKRPSSRPRRFRRSNLWEYTYSKTTTITYEKPPKKLTPAPKSPPDLRIVDGDKVKRT